MVFRELRHTWVKCVAAPRASLTKIAMAAGTVGSIHSGSGEKSFFGRRERGMQIGRFALNRDVKGSGGQRILPMRWLRRGMPRPESKGKKDKTDNRS